MATLLAIMSEPWLAILLPFALALPVILVFDIIGFMRGHGSIFEPPSMTILREIERAAISIHSERP